MKNVIYTFAVLLLSASGFSQSSYLFETTPYGSRLAAKSEINPVTGYTTYSTINNLGIWETKATSVPNIFDKGASTLYTNDIFGGSNISSFSTTNIGGGSTIYSKSSAGGFSATDIIIPNYGGSSSIYSRNDAGSFVPSGYYSPSSGKGYINSSTSELPSTMMRNSIYSSLPSLPSFSNTFPSMPSLKF
jgi:hypothetical protein